MVSKVMVLRFLILLFITSWRTMNLLYQSLQILREVEQKRLSSSFGIRCPLKTCLMNSLARKDLLCEERVFNCRQNGDC